MKSSAVLLAAGALLVSAMPLDKRALDIQWVTDIVTVTVTVDPSASASATPTAGGVFVQNVSEQPAAAPSPQPAAPAPKPVYAPPPPAAPSPQPAAPAPKPVYAPPPPPAAPSPKPAVTPQSAPQAAPQPAPASSAPAAAPKPVIVPAESPAPAPEPSPSPTPEVVVAKPAPSPSPSPKPAPSPSPAPKPAPSPSPKPAPAPSPSPKPAASSPAASAPASGNDYSSIVVNEHNIHRANHSAPDLAWDTTLAGYAQTIAEGCVFAHDMTQGGGGYGQNLASWGSTGDIDDLQLESARRGITDQWYNDEVENWTFFGLDNPPSGFNPDAWGHFTQLVWKSSTKVGCYTAKCPAGTVLSMPSWYTVCNYGPPGNFGGEYAENVLPALGHPTVTI